MTGCIKFDISTSKLRYSIELKRKVSIICGASGTGKTELFRLILDYNNQLENPSVDLGVRVNTNHNIFSIAEYSVDKMIEQIRSKKDSVIVLDENYIGKFISRKLAKCINESDNYFVIIHRGKFDTLSVAYDSIYNIHMVDGVNTLEQVYKTCDKVE